MQPIAQKIAELVEFPDWLMYGIAAQFQSIFGSSVDAFNNAVLKQVAPQGMQWLNDWQKNHVHQFSKKLPLMHPEGVIFASTLYILVILALYPIGQFILGKLAVKNFSMVHNFFLFALSTYMWFSICVTAVASGFSFWNIAIDLKNPNSWRMAKLIWVFYVSKLPEFIDTVIMMLKQNYRQVSFLHLYHHATIFIIWFFVTLEGPGGDAYFSAQLNSLVHVFMYFYYLATVFAGEKGALRSFLNSIKFIITKGQMTQFALNCVQSGYLLWVAQTNNYPRHLIQLLFYYMITLLCLFGNFLIQNQGSADGKGSGKKKGTGAVEQQQTEDTRQTSVRNSADVAEEVSSSAAATTKVAGRRSKKE